MSAVLDRPRLTVPIGGRDHVRGPASAPLALLEYGDYECPFCRAAQPAVETLIDILGEELCFAYRHFPLTQIHPHAQTAAEAAESAAQQGSFWEMHAMLYEHQARLDPPHLLAYGRTLGLDIRRMAFELEEHVHLPRVREDFLSGVRSGANGTPTFFVDGVRHNGPLDVTSLLASLKATA
ncbi:MAG: DsbA family protein [Gaiellaceae bacterium]